MANEPDDKEKKIDVAKSQSGLKTGQSAKTAQEAFEQLKRQQGQPESKQESKPK